MLLTSSQTHSIVFDSHDVLWWSAEERSDTPIKTSLKNITVEIEYWIFCIYKLLKKSEIFWFDFAEEVRE